MELVHTYCNSQVRVCLDNVLYPKDAFILPSFSLVLHLLVNYVSQISASLPLGPHGFAALFSLGSVSNKQLFFIFWCISSLCLNKLTDPKLTLFPSGLF